MSKPVFAIIVFSMFVGTLQADPPSSVQSAAKSACEMSQSMALYTDMDYWSWSNSYGVTKDNAIYYRGQCNFLVTQAQIDEGDAYLDLGALNQSVADSEDVDGDAPYNVAELDYDFGLVDWDDEQYASAAMQFEAARLNFDVAYVEYLGASAAAMYAATAYVDAESYFYMLYTML